MLLFLLLICVDYPDFPSGPQMFAYLKSYYLHYQLDKHTTLNTEAKLVRPLKPQELKEVSQKDGKEYKELWEVTLRYRDGDNV